MSVYLDVCDLETPTVKRSRPGWTVALQKERAGIEESSGYPVSESAGTANESFTELLSQKAADQAIRS